jgi:hypothetical protein
VPRRASFRGSLNSSSTINGLRPSVRNGEGLPRERQEQGVMDVVEGHQQTLMAACAVCWVALGESASEYRAPRGSPQRQIASHIARHHPADIWPRVSSSNTLFRSGTVSPIPHSRLSRARSCLEVIGEFCIPVVDEGVGDTHGEQQKQSCIVGKGEPLCCRELARCPLPHGGRLVRVQNFTAPVCSGVHAVLLVPSRLFVSL